MSSNIRVARICNYCQKEFVARTTVTKYCSHKCSSRAYKLRARLEKVETSRIEMVKVKSPSTVDLAGREFLTVRQAAQLLSSSPKAIYNMVESGRLVSIRLSTRKTLIRRAEIDAFFDAKEPLIDMRPLLQQRKFNLSDAYHMAEVQEKYGVSEKALYDLIKRFEIPKVAKGCYVYVPKRDIDILFNLKSS